MKNYKYLRVLVCLALVCCLIINISPIKAHAVGIEWLFGQVATDIGVSGILKGLGLFRDTLNGDEYYNNLVSDVKDHLASSGQVAGDVMDVWWRIDPTQQQSFLTIPLATILTVRNYIFDENIAVSNNNYNSTYYMGACSSYSQALAYAYNCPRAFIGYIGDVRYVIVTENDSKIKITNGELAIAGSWGTHSVWCSNYTTWETRSSSSSIYIYKQVEELTTSPLVKTDKPLKLGFIAPPTTLFDVAYPQWLEHQKEDEDGTNVPMVQIGLGTTQEETESLTQEQIWAGEGTLTVPEQSQVSGSVILPGWLQQGIENLRLGLKDILDTLISLPAAIAEKIAAIFIPSTDYITAKVDALRGEFGFIDSVIATGEFIRDSVSGASGPPVIYVDLGRAPSGNYGSQRVLLTDFSWYAPYKSQVDTVLSAALWAFFGWRVFMKLPGIIGGESGYISDVFFSSSSGRSGSDDKKKGGKG